MKTCIKCVTDKPELEFTKDLGQEDGRSIYCRECAKQYRIERGLTKPPGWKRKTEDMAAYRVEYAKRNPDKYRRTPEEERERYYVKMRKLHGDQWMPHVNRKPNRLPEPERTERRKKSARERKKRYLDSHPHIKKARKAAYNGKRRSTCKTGGFTRHDIADLLVSQNGCCKLCSTDIRDSYEVDHVEPLTAGGSNAPTNIQLLCKPCNVQKGGRSSFG